LGKKFVDGDINARKRVLHELFGSLKIVQLTANLAERPMKLCGSPLKNSRSASENGSPTKILWKLLKPLSLGAAFAEFFGYNDDTKEIYLDVGQESA
jgi:hypothetical protein